MGEKPHITFQGTSVLKSSLEDAADEWGITVSEVLRRVTFHGLQGKLYEKPIPKKRKIKKKE